MRRLLHSILVVLALGCPCQMRAQDNPATPEIRRFLAHLAKHDRFMGAAAVSVDGRLIFHNQYGLLAEDNRAVNSETLYRIGSITKTITTVMILQLVEEGKVSLDARLSKFYPDLTNADAISVEQMLRHRSGLGSITDDPTYRRWNTQPQSRDEMLKRIAAQPTKFQPGERTEYSNTNYVLLGYIIEQVTGNSYADALQRRISARLGLKRTRYAVPASVKENVARSFQRADQRWVSRPETDPSIPHGAGAIISTPVELVAFIEGLFGGKLVGTESLAMMTRLQGNMGMGLMQFPFGDKRAWGHNGGIDGFQSTLAYFPADKTAYAMITNGIDYPFNDVSIGILSATFGHPVELPSLDKSQEMEVAAETLERYAGVYASDAFPLKITVRVEGKKLMAQATGQAAFALTPKSEVEFHFQAAGIVIEFSESAAGGGFDRLRLQQAGQDIPFVKQEQQAD